LEKSLPKAGNFLSENTDKASRAHVISWSVFCSQLWRLSGKFNINLISI